MLQTLKAKDVAPLWLGLGGGAQRLRASSSSTEPLMSELWQPHVAGENLAAALSRRARTTWNSPPS